MTAGNIKSVLRQSWIFYLLGFVLVFGLKYFYSKASSDQLDWILAPTARWVRILSGIPFERVAGSGYINHTYRFIIASSCSGIQFMIITIAMLIYSYIHRMKTLRQGFCWLLSSLAAAYLFTVFVNGFRILLAIYLPLYLFKNGIDPRFLTPERLHTIIGIVIYFTALFIIFHIAGFLSAKIAGITYQNPDAAGSAFGQLLRRCFLPTFWYFSIMLGLPLLNRAYQNDGQKFIEFAILMTVVCLSMIVLFGLVAMIRQGIGKHRK